jgi:trehalose utilization protein
VVEIYPEGIHTVLVEYFNNRKAMRQKQEHLISLTKAFRIEVHNNTDVLVWKGYGPWGSKR